MTAKKRPKKFLMVLDPLKKLSARWDTSLRLIQELNLRGHKVWTCDVQDLWFEKRTVYASARQTKSLPEWKYFQSTPKIRAAEFFDMILVRKEPPFDLNYLYLTHLLELIADRIPVVNHPRGIRGANEKLSALNFTGRIPESLVTADPERILQFRKRLRCDLVLKPLDQKGGRNVSRLRWREKKPKRLVNQLFRQKKFIQAQRLIKDKQSPGDKRILILNGKILAAYEKHPKKGDFRGNLSLGATYHPTDVKQPEKRLVAHLKPYLRREGILFAGIDVIDGKLIEINVTCPAGIAEAEKLYPTLKLARAWAICLENLPRSWPAA